MPVLTYQSKSKRVVKVDLGKNKSIIGTELAEAENIPPARTRSVIVNKDDMIAMAREILAFYGELPTPATPSGPTKLGELAAGSFVKNFASGKIAKIVHPHNTWGATAEYQGGERLSIYNTPDEFWWHPVTVSIETSWKEV